jgi:hypothetical protein
MLTFENATYLTHSYSDRLWQKILEVVVNSYNVITTANIICVCKRQRERGREGGRGREIERERESYRSTKESV